MSFMNASQQIIFDALDGNLTSCDIYDTAPVLPEGMPNSGFPYCVIGEDTFGAWDTDSNTGGDITVTLHFWSRADAMKEVKALMGEAYNLLHRATLTKTGYNVVDCLCEFQQAMTDPDGRTKHGVMRFRLTMATA